MRHLYRAHRRFEPFMINPRRSSALPESAPSAPKKTVRKKAAGKPIAKKTTKKTTEKTTKKTAAKKTRKVSALKGVKKLTGAKYETRHRPVVYGEGQNYYRSPFSRSKRAGITINPLGSALMVANPKRSKHMRKNPLGFLKTLQPKTLLPLIAFGGAGAVTTGLAPLVIKKFMPTLNITNLVKYGAQATVAVGGGLLVTKFADRNKGIAWMVGSLAIVVSDVVITALLPRIGLGAFTESLGAFTNAFPNNSSSLNGDTDRYDLADRPYQTAVEDSSGGVSAGEYGDGENNDEYDGVGAFTHEQESNAFALGL